MRKTETLIRLPKQTKDLLIELALSVNLSLSEYVALLIEEKRNEQEKESQSI